MASEALNTMIDQIRSMDTDLPGGGETIDIVTATVSEYLTEWTGSVTDAEIEGALTVLALLVSRAASLNAAAEMSDGKYETVLDLGVEFSLALCRLHS